MPEKHAVLSPSSAERWMTCAGAPAMEHGQPDSTSKYAAEGTLGHAAAAELLRGGEAPAVGSVHTVDGHQVEYSDDLDRAVRAYVRYVEERVQYHLDADASVMLEVEQAVPIGHVTGEEGAEGTADAVIMAEYRDGRCVMDVIDAKFGRGVVVNAGSNPQTRLYAEGAREKFSLVFEPNELYTHIAQPRVEGGFSREGFDADELARWVESVRPKARDALVLYDARDDRARIEKNLNPSDKACRFCKAAGVCPKLREVALSTVADDFVNLDEPLQPQLGSAIQRIAASDDEHLDSLFPVLDLIENWITAVRTRIEGRLLAGAQLRNAKLVEGKKGNRKWKSVDVAETALRSMRLKHEQIFDYSLISPTQAEKLFKDGAIGPRQWPRLKDLIEQAPGKPSVAPASDKREALVLGASASEFEDLDAARDPAEDLA